MKLAEVFPLVGRRLSDIDEMTAETVTRWAEQDVIPKRLEHRENRETLLLPAYRSLAVDIGLQTMMWPEESGGSGRNEPEVAVATAAVVEQAARGDVGIAFVLAHALAVQAMLFVGREDDAASSEPWREAFGGGQSCFVSVALPGLTTHAAAETLHGLAYPIIATRNGSGWTLSGSDIRAQAMARDATLFAVCAAVEGEPALFLVPADAAGITVGDEYKTTGLAISRDALVDFNDVVAGDDACAFRGLMHWRRFQSWLCLGSAAACVGATLAGWEILKEWGESRVIKGKGQIFKENPLVASSLGEIGGAIGTNRLLVFDLARLIADEYANAAGNASGLFASATAIAQRVCRESMNVLDRTMELMASAGYATEWELERYWRDVKTVESRLGPWAAARADMARHYFDLQTL
ncbi:MAG: acyl-CoA dehydrogenase family protein [Candidatus Lernaella stagnicola]|nr:acyl-CoA dehydrogenase family protein [Candidatus Lernaella stagnicola]